MLHVRPIPYLVAGLILLLSAVPAVSASEMLQGKDPKAKPFLEAIHALTKPLSAGDSKKAEEQFVGEKADLELLHAYVKAIAAEKELATAMDKKFGADKNREAGAVTSGIDNWGGSFEYNNVVVDGKKASCSASGPVGVGIDFARSGDGWKVSSLASAPEKPQDHKKKLDAYTGKIAAIARDVTSGKITDAAGVQKAIGDRFELFH